MCSRVLPGSLWLLALLPAGALADEDGGAMNAAAYLTQLIGGLMIVIVAIVVLAWVLRRTQGSVGHGRQMIDVQSVRSVGARERLMLVRVGDEQVLIGVAPSGIRTLHTMETPVEVPAGGEGPDFSGVLKRAVRSRRASGGGQES
ncbi:MULTISPECIES: flagellar biosynthetic protein FliO [unclassified Thioalkalivibrio]|uniref:flagellar biosynthetic protein FliO n=1 Tax=unclassified Thioalkalivibrio TaxID=2621013 RepID=UPI00036EA5E5|nr:MULTISPECIES: flagellar biosynthetic protein FliO [unclassified Thioalkalivibrio]PYG04074.1 flagellar protein FliO/FliZ [Thioalkalivibrio sp. ALE21]